MPFLDDLMAAFTGRSRAGRKAAEPKRDTIAFPELIQRGNGRGVLPRRTPKPTSRNLRYFSRTPYARRAINAIKNPICELDWEIVPAPGVKENPELARQIEIATYCLSNPNTEDSWRSMTEQVIEDVLIGAGAIETQVAGDPQRPLWMYPTDGLSIQVYPAWSGDRREARYAQGIIGSLGGQNQVIDLRDDELIYIRPNPTTATPFGLGPLEVAFLSISRQLGVAEFSGNVTSNAKPSILLDLGEGSSKEDLAAFRSYWTNEIEGQGKTPIAATKGGDVRRLYPDGDTALFLHYQDFLKSEIATAFDLSPQNLGVERDVNRSTGEVAEGRDWDHAIKPRAREYASYLTRHALHRRLGFYQLHFRFVGLDREDEFLNAQTYKLLYDSNAIVPDEYRDRIGLPPHEGPWGTMTAADVQIAIQAARGAAEILDQDLPKPQPGAPKPSREEN